MSATILKERALAAIVDRLNDNARQMMNLKFQPAQTALATLPGTSTQSAVGILPAVSAEQIGLQAVELNATRRALMEAAAIIEEQHKALVAPEEQPDALVQGTNGAAEPRVEPVY